MSEKDTDTLIIRELDKAKIKFERESSTVDEIKEALKTASKRKTGEVGRPEFIAYSGEFILIIEDKKDTKKQRLLSESDSSKLDDSIDACVNFAENGALHYAQHIAKLTNFKKIFAFGCSGDKEHYIIRPIFVDDSEEYILLPEVQNFNHFSKENIEKYYKEIVLGEEPPESKNDKKILEESKKLNEYLRDYGQIHDNQKPLVVSAILLALKSKNNIDTSFNGEITKDGDNVNIIDSDGIKIFNALSKTIDTSKVKSKEILKNQFSFIKTDLNLNKVHDKLAMSPLKFFTNYIKTNIFPLISENHDDILGTFYSEFIKYSGGDKKSLGIVLTPKHITELFCDLLKVTSKDKVFDPCVGTGGFLVAAMNRMFEQINMDETLNEEKFKEEKENIKKNNLHGIEIRGDMFSIATTNMILRGDGKSNLVLADFFDIDSTKSQEKKYTVGMMNPPYSQGGDLGEIKFIKHLLNSLHTGARCAVIVPQSVFGKKEYNDDKEEILKTHTLEGVITLNGDTSFYRVGTHPCIGIFTAHKKHPTTKRCKFIDFRDDGYYLAPHIGIIKTPRASERKDYLLKCWNDELDPDSEFMIKTTVEFDDDWLHSYYYFNTNVPLVEEFQETIAEYINFEYNMVLQNRDYLFLKEDSDE